MQAGGDFLVGTQGERGGAQPWVGAGRESREPVKRMGLWPGDERVRGP